jgi:hypothetical protein
MGWESQACATYLGPPLRPVPDHRMVIIMVIGPWL